jgi:thioredoxin 1
MRNAKSELSAIFHSQPHRIKRTNRSLPMFDRRIFLAVAANALVFAGAAVARAAEQTAFTQEGFAAAQKAGRPILVHITASWCPTCKAQRPILSQLTAEPKFKDLAVFDVDFDSQKDVVRAFNARMQSTLITFKGPAELGRSVGDTDAKSIEALLDRTV